MTRREHVRQARLAKVVDDSREIAIGERQRLGIGNGKREPRAHEQVARGADVDLRVPPLDSTRGLRGQRCAARACEARAADERAQKQPVGAQHTSRDDQRAGDVVDTVQATGDDDQIEARGREGKGIFLGDGAAIASPVGSGIGDSHGDALRSQRRDDRWISTDDECVGKAPRDVCQAVEDRCGDLARDKAWWIVGDPVAPRAPRLAIEQYGTGGGGHGPGCGGFLARRQGAVLIRRLITPAIDFVLPPRCPSCATIVTTANTFCDRCWSAVDFLTTSDPLNDRTHRYDAVLAATRYGEVTGRVAVRFKHGRVPALATMIGRAVARRWLGARRDGAAILVPVPLHRWRLWSRGFNQAHAIARVVAKHTGLPLASAVLTRRRGAAMSRGAGAAARRAAVANAFVASDVVAGSHVVLVDDVLTTGATADACADALKRAGARRVTVLCWAQVMTDD